MKPDLTAFNIDISGCQGQWLQGLSRLSRLKEIGLGPTAVTYGEILKACLKSEDRRGVTKSTKQWITVNLDDSPIAMDKKVYNCQLF